MIRPAMPVTAPTRCTAGACRTCVRSTSTKGPMVTLLMGRSPGRGADLLRPRGRKRGQGAASLRAYEDDMTRCSLAEETVRKHGQLGLLAGIGEAEAAAHLAVTGLQG